MPISNITFTPNLHLSKLPANYRVWAQIMNDNLTMMDAAISGFITFSNLRGTWANSTIYAIGDTVVDGSTAVLYTCAVAHTSPVIPTTFAQDRINHPTYWFVAAAAATNRGAWATATVYNRNDFVLADGTKYAMCLVGHTSGATFTADLALGYWTVLIDLSVVGSLVLPVLSGGADANKVVMASSSGSSYVINSINALINLFPSTGTLGNVVFSASPTLTGSPIAPTQAAETNNTTIGTTAYGDRAVRSVITRMQTFSSSGTYTPNPKMIQCLIEGWGGGSGGGAQSAAPGGVGTQSNGGGGSGAYSRKWCTPADIGASKTVTIGAAGAAGTSGGTSSAAGGTTSVGTLVIANGAPGGLAIGGSTAGDGATIAGAAGDETFPGMPGGGGVYHSGSVPDGSSGFGGSPLGGVGVGGKSVHSTGPGLNAGGFGAGGSGAATKNTTGPFAGGNATAGYVRVTETCWG